MNHSKGLLALSPIAVFLLVYLAGSLIAHDFYAVPVWAAFLAACIYALIVPRSPVKPKLVSFLHGATQKNVLQMIGIFILAGAFAGSAKAMGAVEATVGTALEVIPPKMILAGLFLTACFISMAVGTSVGTIVALVPISTGIASQTGTAIPYTTAVVVGGAFFGDNLSFISDTTIAATKALGIRMNEKFKANLGIIWPAVVIVTIIYLIKGLSISAEIPVTEAPELIKILPYLIIIVLGIFGVNVLISLALGITANLTIGLVTGSTTFPAFISASLSGIGGMTDLITVTLLAGGLLAIIRDNGGLDYITESLTKGIHGRRGAEKAIAGIVSLANLCTANNTIAILTVGGIAGDIGKRFGIDPRRSASLLDTFSCMVQGLLPYGAQLLMASDLAGTTPLQIIPFLYYPFIMGICAMARILL